MEKQIIQVLFTKFQYFSKTECHTLVSKTSHITNTDDKRTPAFSVLIDTKVCSSYLSNNMKVLKSLPLHQYSKVVVRVEGNIFIF